VWNTGERTEVHEEVKRKHGFVEQDIRMRISLYVINNEELIFECSEWIFWFMTGYSGRFSSGLFLLMK